jgi:tRNA(Ile)-lysidine synthase
MSLQDLFQQAVDAHGMFRREGRVLVAVSGGADSTALLQLLVRLARSMPMTLHVAHLDHGLRGEESVADRRFVEEMAAGLGVPFTSRVLEPAGRLSEDQARAHRHRFLGHVAQTVGAQRIATGHTRDDQAETLLLNLLRGAGTRGLAGIPAVRGRYVRPLLMASRQDVEGWLREQQILWREDASNEDRSFTRNRVRHELLPLLEQDYRPGIRGRLAATAKLLQDDQDLLTRLAGEHYRRLVEPCPDGMALDAPGLRALPPALSRRLLRRAYRDALPGAQGPGRALVARLETLLAGIRPGATDLAGGLEAVLDARSLVVRRRRTAEPFRAEADVPGRLSWPEAGICLKMQEVDRERLCSDIRHESREIAHLDLGRTGRHLELRSRRPGDAFYPLGLGGRKKLQDFLVDAGVPRRQRDQVGLLTAGGEVAWVVGQRVDDRFKVTADTTRVLLVQQERE